MPRHADAPYRIWGDNLDSTAVDQLKNACKLPVAVAAALMPDAHVGYGLPIGGVLATRDAVIPYAVGVDIACRMKLTVLDLPVHTLATDQSRLTAGHRAGDTLRNGCVVPETPAARRHGCGLACVERDGTDEGSRLGATRHERKRQPFRRVRRADRARRGVGPRARQLPRAAQPLRQPRHWCAGRRPLQPARTRAAPGTAESTLASGVAGLVVGGGSGGTGLRWS